MEILFTIIRNTFSPLLPSYFQSRTADVKPFRITTTSALDGIRGIAALFVFCFHLLFSYQQFIEYGYGQSDQNMRLVQFPFLSIFHRGHSMVAVFFVVGGYVLSLKPLKLISSGQVSSAHDVLASSALRRVIRLYLPAFVATFLTMITVYFGLWEYPRQFIDTTEYKKYIFYADAHPARQSNFKAQIKDWLTEAMGLTGIFTYYNHGFSMPYYNSYDPHLWTVPFELRSSLTLVLMLLMLSRCTHRARVVLLLVAITFCATWDRWELVAFLSGSVLCALDTNASPSSATTSPTSVGERSDSKLPLHSSSAFSTAETAVLPRKCSCRRLPWMLLFIASIYLLCTPNFAADSTPGYVALSSLLTPTTYTDPKRGPQTLGAIGITWAVANCPTLQRPFNTRFAQYLGKISYAFYIVHGPAIHIIGYSVTPALWRAAGVTMADGAGAVSPAWAKYWTCLALGTAVLAVVIAVVADWFWRIVDVRCVKVARWFEDVCSSAAVEP
ncbi:hypothetical protein EJ06DRAFT_362847 [Trichodelitschia bisporula]|uniref:Acyltransferase 3 domain-containing protein n=1 Tax=Trichodelitschia bisporula TaxID=703511 RepID=A0A6G1I179_9PEZI|nr:hypothetical protein EJ06DRAFT_362847 [Trichodelitschia bisporula]